MFFDISEDWDAVLGPRKGRGQYKDLAGKRFGRLLVESKIGSTPGGSAVWRCICDCGSTKDIPREVLRKGRAKSCGCLLRENQRKTA